MGFIGHHIVKILKEKGHDVAIMDNLTTYGIVDPKLLDLLIEDRKNWCQTDPMRGDISSMPDVLHAVSREKPDTIIHLAGFPRAKIVNANPVLASKTMIDGIENLLEASVVCSSVKRFVYISSSMVYGDFSGGITEDAKLTPTSIYASFKIAGEQMVKLYASKSDMSYTIVRPSAVYGPRDVEDRVVSKFFMNALRDKPINVNGVNERLDFSFVEDTAMGIVLAATKEAGHNETFNITYGEDRLILEGAELVKKIVGKGEINIRERNMAMPSRGYLDISKARTLLGYDPSTPIELGFRKYYEWIISTL